MSKEAEVDGPHGPEADNAALVRRIYEEGFNGGTPKIYDECYLADFRHHSKIDHDVDAGAAGEKQSMYRFRASIPDVHFDIHELLADGDKVAARLTITGTTAEAYSSIPSGTTLSIHAMALFRIAEGKAAEEWFFVEGTG